MCVTAPRRPVPRPLPSRRVGPQRVARERPRGQRPSYGLWAALVASEACGGREVPTVVHGAAVGRHTGVTACVAAPPAAGGLPHRGAGHHAHRGPRPAPGAEPRAGLAVAARAATRGIRLGVTPCPAPSEGRPHPVRIARFSIDGNVAFGAVEGDTETGRARPRHHQGHPVRGLRALRHEGPAEQGPAAAARAPQQGRRLRPQLRGAREGAGQRGPRRPVRLLQAVHLGDRPRRPDRVPLLLRGAAPRGRTGRGHRPDVPRGPARARQGRHPRLHLRQRRHRARRPEAREAVGAGQGLRHLLPARPLGGDRPRPVRPRRSSARSTASSASSAAPAR